jgi:hypothetical protein
MKNNNSLKMLFITLCLATVTLPSMAGSTKPANEVAVPSADPIMNRLEEIKAMDMKSMSPLEKKQIRKEMKDLKAQKKQDIGGGVYISVGALILIIILLIILL